MAPAVRENEVQQALEHKTRSLMDRVAEHRFAVTAGIFLAALAVISAGSGIGVSPEIANKIREYVTAILH